jgi:ubiquinone/menaquinone biosynthesis C-methylase UbiE
MPMSEPLGKAPDAGLLGDTTARNYAGKLRQFNLFAEPELRQLIESLHLSPGMRILDAGCGSGEALCWLQDAVGRQGTVTGVDLAAAHVEAARAHAPTAQIHQGDLFTLALPKASLDFIWCVNTINHLRDPVQGLGHLKTLLQAGGRIAVGQSSFVPDMYFAWDARLERLINEAVRQHYRERYLLEERDLTAVRGLVGLLQQAGFTQVASRTMAIERMAPLDPATEVYLRETIFRDTWGERVKPYLSTQDYAELGRLCDPQHPQFALGRPDFHFLQSFTLVVAGI